MRTKNIRKILSDNVKYYRFKNGYTQEELAEKCDLSPRYLSDIENSKENIPIDTLEVIAFYLKVDPYILLKERKYKLLPKGVNMKKKDSFFAYINQLELSFQENLVFF